MTFTTVFHNDCLGEGASRISQHALDENNALIKMEKANEGVKCGLYESTAVRGPCSETLCYLATAVFKGCRDD